MVLAGPLDFAGKSAIYDSHGYKGALRLYGMRGVSSALRCDGTRQCRSFPLGQGLPRYFTPPPDTQRSILASSGNGGNYMRGTVA